MLRGREGRDTPMTPWILAAKLLASAAGMHLDYLIEAPATGETPEAATSSSGTPAIAPKKGPRAPAEDPRPPAPRGESRAAATPEVEIGIWPDDASRLPRLEPPGVVRAPAPGRSPLLGWSGALAEPEFVDRTHRVPWVPRPADFGATMRPGERFKFEPAQDLSSHLGKIIRIRPDGAVVTDTTGRSRAAGPGRGRHRYARPDGEGAWCPTRKACLR